MWFVACALVLAGGALVRWRSSGQSFGIFIVSLLVYVYARLWHRLAIDGPGSIPDHGPAIVVANHTCGADSAFLTAASPRPLSFLIADEYGNIPLLRRLLEAIACVPVRRNGRDVTAVRLSLRRLQHGRAVCVFPEGGLSRAGRDVRPRGKAGVALLALRSGAPVVPALIRGGPQTDAVADAWLRPTRVRVTLGRPIDLSAYADRDVDRRLLDEVTSLLMHRILALSNGDAPTSSSTNGSADER
jgi:1-acyl-sn-glycerol-3-phosphate acyltransferase